MSWKKSAAGYFIFSKKDRIAAALFSGVLLLIYLLPRAFPKPSSTAVQEDTALRKLLDSATQSARTNPAENTEPETGNQQYGVLKKLDFSNVAVFDFDPNTLDAAGWESLGLRVKTINTILKYRSKGGHFYKREDLKKIWGLPDGFYEHVKDHIQLAEAKKEDAATTNFFKTPYEKKERAIATVDVNRADTTELIALPGIGSKLAQRIVAFRDKLGGFYTTDQIGETYGLPDSTFQKLKPYLQVHGGLTKLNLNTATKDALKIHPYIKWNLANAIVEYRTQHGLFKKLDDLKNIVLIDDATFAKLAPYFTLD